MAENEAAEQNASFFVKGLSIYVTQLYEHSNRETEDAEGGEIYVSPCLRTILRGCVDNYKDSSFLDEFISYVSLEDRLPRLTRDVKVKLIELGKTTTHADFLRACALYILTAVDLEDKGFTEAPDVVVDVICEAIMDTKQREYLYLWESETFPSVYELDPSSD